MRVARLKWDHNAHAVPELLHRLVILSIPDTDSFEVLVVRWRLLAAKLFETQYQIVHVLEDGECFLARERILLSIRVRLWPWVSPET